MRRGARAATEVHLCDVGFVSPIDGAFYRLFNARVSDTHSWNEDGVPQSYEPIHLDEHHISRNANYIGPGPHASDTTLEVTGGLGAGL